MSSADPRPVWERYRGYLAVGRHVLVYREVTSTMDVAWSLAEAGALHGTVVRADVQRAGRGRFARRWESAPGDSLLTSSILRMPPLSVGAPLSVAATLAVFDCVSAYVTDGVRIKWPNDVLVGGKKIAGVLVESRVTTDGSGVAVAGIGLNVNLDPSRFEGIAETATSLAAQTGSTVDVDGVEERLLNAMDRWVGMLETSVEELLDAWRSHLETLGQSIAVHTRQGVVSGMAEDVDGSGRLLLRDDRGVLHVLAEGDVSLRA